MEEKKEMKDKEGKEKVRKEKQKKRKMKGKKRPCCIVTKKETFFTVFFSPCSLFGSKRIKIITSVFNQALMTCPK